jgi:pyruvate/2-oxoglutarate dehydrogenase complex dihydrolipoamide dehydrogenase (E3) component
MVILLARGERLHCSLRRRPTTGMRWRVSKVLIEEGSNRIVGAHLVGPHADKVSNIFAVVLRSDARQQRAQAFD